MKEDLLKIINHYGYRHQKKKLNEEVFELQESIEDYERQKNVCQEFCSRLHCDKELEHMEEEFADVMVLLSQIKYYYELDSERIKEIMKQKVDRQLDRMKEE